MSKQVRLRRGTALEHETFTGANAELTVDTTHSTLRLHDGVTTGGKVIGGQANTITDLRNFQPTVGGQSVEVLGHTIAGIGGGQFYYDPDDTTSADNNGTVIVTSGGHRWKRMVNGFVTPQMFGCVIGSQQAGVQAAVNYCASFGNALFIPNGIYSLTETISVPDTDGFRIYGEGNGSIITSTAFTLLYISGAGVQGLDVSYLKLIKSTSNFGYVVAFRNGTRKHKLHNCTLLSKHSLVQSGHPSEDTETPEQLEIYSNSMLSDGTGARGCRTRTAPDGKVNQNIVFRNNTVIVDNDIDGDIGIECWSGGVTLEGNYVIAPRRNGGASGLVLGTVTDNKVVNNYVYGFEIGIEIGGSQYGAHIISGNTMKACATGFTLSTSGTEKSVIVANNTCIQDVNERFQGQDLSGDKPFIRAFRTKAPNTIFSNNIAILITHLPYTDPASRESTAFYTDTADRFINLSGNYIEGFENGMRLAATSPLTNITGNVFNNVTYPVADSGGVPTHSITGNIFHNFYACSINYKADFVNNTFSRDSDFVFPRAGLLPSNCVYAQAIASADNIEITNVRNKFIECKDTCLAPDTNFPAPGTGRARPQVEIREDVWRVKNHADWPSVKAALATISRPIPYNTPVQTWSTNLTFIKRYGGQQPDIIDGDDVVENFSS